MTLRRWLSPALAVLSASLLAPDVVAAPGTRVRTRLVPSAAARAAGPLQASVQVEKTDVRVGEPVRVTVQVKNADGPPDIQVPKTDGLTLSKGGPISSVPSILAGLEPVRPGGPIPGAQLTQALRDLMKQIPADAFDPNKAGGQGLPPDLMKEYQAALASLNGAANLNHDDHTVSYLLQADRAGKLTLPAFTVTAGGHTTTTQPVALNAADTVGPQLVEARLSLSDPNPVPGAEVKLYVDLLIPRGPVTYGGKSYPHYPVKGVVLNVPTLEDVRQLEPVRPLDQVLRDMMVPQGHRGYRVNTFPAEVVFEHEADGVRDLRDGQKYYRRLTVPVRVCDGGAVEVPPVRAAGEVYVPGAAPVAQGAGAAAHWQPFVAVSPPLKMSIREFPNKPSNYNGGVGIFTLSASASQTEMPVGTPFTLTLKQDGQGNLDRVNPPDLNGQPGFADRFVSHFDSKRVTKQGCEFTYTLRPRSEAVTEVPAITISFYNQTAGRFDTAQSKPIPLKVSPAPAGALADIAPGNEAQEAEDSDAAPPARSRALRWAFFNGGLLLAGLLALVGRRGWKRYRAHRAVRVQERQTLDQFRQRLQAPHVTVDEVRRTLHDFVRHRLSLPAGEVTPQDAEAALARAGYSAALARAFADVLNRCAEAEFAPGVPHPSAAELAALAEQAIQAVLSATPQPPVVVPVDVAATEPDAAVVG
jgi:hypothetical protein